MALEAAHRFADSRIVRVRATLLGLCWALSCCLGACEELVVLDSAEPPGVLDAVEIAPEIFGLVGQVREPNGSFVSSGTVFLVPAADVAGLADTPIDLFLSPEETAAATNDEPIEDLVDLRGDTYERATVDLDGVYRFSTLPDGDHFVVWFPDETDARHLPGGDYARVSFSMASLVGMRMDLRVSATPGATATYVGSSVCMVCHGLQSTTRTAHNVGLQVPGVRSILQDIEPWPDFDLGLEAFDAGTTLFYASCNPDASDASKCEVTEDPPPGPVSFEIGLRRDPSVPLGSVGAYYVELVNRTNTEPTIRYDVVLTYGGALFRQQYLMRRTNSGGSFSYFLLPLQFNYQGDFENPDPDDWPWRDYRSDQWFDFEAGAIREPANGESFDNNCAGCHFTGYSLDGDDTEGWAARAVVDLSGAFDYDGDGRPELINVGCESCHGPGSEHLELAPRGGAIVSPGSLTPGRATMLCGSCHSRPVGIGGGMTGLPLSASDEMPSPGLRRAHFAVDNTTRVGGAPSDFFASGDAFSHYQQYSGHLQAQHYRNPTRMSDCTGCHNPHANFDDVYGSAVEENLNAVCVVCHSEPEFLTVLEHVATVTGFSHDTITREFRCTECHMVPTAKSGAAVKALLDMIPSMDPPVQYYWNDIAAHRMSMTGREAYQEQPVAATNACAPCHGGFFPNR